MNLATLLAIVALVIALIALAVPFVVSHSSTTTTQGQPNVNVYAVINGTTGDLDRGFGITANAMIVSTGVYIVTFAWALFGCTYQAGLGTDLANEAGPGTATVVASAAPYNSSYNLTVTVHNGSTGDLADATFHIAASCPGGLWAVVGPKGELLNGAGVNTSFFTGSTAYPGRYAILFGQNVSNCAYIAGLGTSFGSSPGGTAATAQLGASPWGVWVNTYDSAGVSLNETFHVQVFC